MSKRFLTRLAGGVAFASAALLLGTPVAALASDGYDNDKRDGGGVFCGNAKQINKVIAANIVSDNEVEDSDFAVAQDASADATNENDQGGGPTDFICVGDVELDLELELD